MRAASAVTNHASARGAWNTTPSVREVRVQQRDQRLRVRIRQVVDAAAEEDVVAPGDERDGIGEEDGRGARIETGAERGKLRERCIGGRAGAASPGGVEAVVRDGRRAGANAAMRARPGIRGEDRGIERQQVGKGEDETHGRCFAAARGTLRGAPSLACDNSPPSHR